MSGDEAPVPASTSGPEPAVRVTRRRARLERRLAYALAARERINVRIRELDRDLAALE